ncbi:mutator family transposase [Herbihabitans rhizosphaerae]|uniref:Mutator family transposase n=1 Tax=Herbihabitans rhizosphaerae TaxID=1872711 RepID=A0A4Q7KKP4_9PSEU|nr:mutator family transposase [Herbihabitans rhizosphaerae]
MQTCTVHLIRAAMRFVSYADRKKVAAALKPIYTAPTAEAAAIELAAFTDSDLGRRYPAAVSTWHNAWERFIPFLAFSPEIRKIIYTTNAIESLNYQLRKIIKNRGHFPTDDAVIKLLWLAIRDIEDKRARQRAKEKGSQPTNAKPHPASSKAPPSKAGNKPRRPRPGLPRPPQPTPRLTTTSRSTYTANLTSPGSVQLGQQLAVESVEHAGLLPVP